MIKLYRLVTGYGLWVILFFLTSHLLPITYNPLPVSFSFASETADDVVNRIQKEHELIRDMSGRFVQKSYIKDLEETMEFKGTFFLKKPEKMMWEYAEPRDEKVVIKDKETFIYKKSQNQVIRTKFSEESYSQVPIAMLESFDNIRNDFNISMPEKNALQLIPKKKIGHIKSVIMETSKHGFPIQMFTILDTYGNIIMIELKDIKTNPGLKDELFDFKIPDGAEVFDMSQ
jgi:outer membrane lipoprotein carrier protein